MRGKARLEKMKIATDVMREHSISKFTRALAVEQAILDQIMELDERRATAINGAQMLDGSDLATRRAAERWLVWANAEKVRLTTNLSARRAETMLLRKDAQVALGRDMAVDMLLSRGEGAN